MSWRRGEALTVARVAADDPRALVGIALPYGVVSNDADQGNGVVAREVHKPAAAKASVDHWMTRADGARMPYRARHGQRPVGVVTHLEDTPDGVNFRAQIFPGAAGDEYLAEVAAGINGVSPEFASGSSRPLRGRDGIVLHRETKLFALAGSDMPAFDGARIALRDMEDSPVEPETKDDKPAEAEAQERDTAVKAAGVATKERDTAEREAVQAIVPRSQAVITRPEAVYRPDGPHNYLRDTWLMQKGDSAAYERHLKHRAHLDEIAVAMEREAAARIMDPAYSERAGDLLSSEIPGAYPNDYLPGLLTPRILKGRPMGDFYQRFPISDARPRIFAKVTTSGTVAVQSAEGAALGTTDIATTAVTVNPLMYGATIDVSRQVLDGADPAALAMTYQDLYEAYAQASETVIKTAVEAGSTASGVAITAATPYAGTLANVINYYGVRFKSATGAFIPSALFPVLAAQGDTTGRPFLPMIGAVNSDGRTLAEDLSLDLAVLTARTKLSYASTVNVCVFGRPSDFVIFESPITTIQYDQVVGPQAVRVGLWAYLVVGTRLGSLKVTAA